MLQCTKIFCLTSTLKLSELNKLFKLNASKQIKEHLLLFQLSCCQPTQAHGICHTLKGHLYIVSSVDGISDYNGFCLLLMQRLHQVKPLDARGRPCCVIMYNYSSMSCSGVSLIQMYFPV